MRGRVARACRRGAGAAAIEQPLLAPPLRPGFRRAIQCVGLLLGCVGLGLGFFVAGGWNTIFGGWSGDSCARCPCPVLPLCQHNRPVCSRCCAGLHRNLGVAATALGLLQASGRWGAAAVAAMLPPLRCRSNSAQPFPSQQIPALFWRPVLTSPKRRLFNQAHWWVGRAAALVAVVNVYEGERTRERGQGAAGR